MAPVCWACRLSLLWLLFWLSALFLNCYSLLTYDRQALLDIRNSVASSFTNSYTLDVDCSFNKTDESFTSAVPGHIRRWPLSIPRRKRRRKRGNRGGYIVKLKAHLRAGFLSDHSHESLYGGSATWRPRDVAYRWLRHVLPVHPSPVFRSGLLRIGLGSRRRGVTHRNLRTLERAEMAEASISWAEDQFRCSVCLDLLKDPVTIACGHSYCTECISGCWGEEDWKGIYSCPQCRKTFKPRPVLGKNVVIAEMVEKLNAMRLQSAPVPPPVPTFRHHHHHTVSGEVQCNSCTGIKQKAVKSCLECRSSYCQNHLEQHENLFKDKGHNLMDATERLHEMICPRHNKILEMYCHTDQQCICTLCLMDEHKNHDTVSTAAARTEKQDFSQTAVKESERIFTELIRSIERRRSEVTQLIRDQERAAVSRAEERLERLEQEINDLRWRDAELKQLSHTQDHVHFFQSLFSAFLSGSTDGITEGSHLSFDNVEKTVSKLKDKLQQFSIKTIENIYGRVKTIQVIGAPEYQTREEFIQYTRLLTLDLNSVNYLLYLSEGNTMITVADTVQSYPDHPDRFDIWTEALCRESVCGRCYWEVEWAGDGRLGVDIGVTYKSISRKGDGPESAAGRNDQSWSLFCSPDYCSFWHNNIEAILPVVNISSRIGVYVDESAGILSFYSVSDTMSLIHRVQTTFIEMLYAVFGCDRHSTVELCCLTN
ncbi:Tripartite motif-containing protein 16 [Anabarilius grahami]|uniref:Tripartite motif-containing protein 16 n=1 Tax=Anabarilius grahami TaxID=495550 RepID=A0A3N0XMA3_ANAGA|nr:Tripartite motif-containing protein 16 [Anabarilius grahami]